MKLPPPSGIRAQWAEGRPDLDTSPMEVVGQLKRINALMSQAIESLYETAPLTSPEADVLITLRYAGGPVIARRIAEHHGLSRAGVSKTLAKMEGRGLIARAPNPADKRAALVTITDAGRAAIDALFPRQLAVEKALLEGLGAERATVLEALFRLAGSIEAGVEDLGGTPV